MSEFTVGVEEEYQLIDPGTGDLQSRARSVLAADWTGELRNEMQESTVEIGTRVCHSAAELQEELRRLRFQTAAAASSEGLQIIAAGLHPTSPWQGHRMTEGERYARIADDYGRLARDEHNFGMHVHVGVPAGTDRIRLLNAVRFYVPHLLALSCSSPFYEGADTGYASFRMILWRRWPNSGIPPHFRSADEYRAHVALLLRSGSIGDERNLYWSVRPHPSYPTIEFRVTDVCPLLEDAVAIAALARAIVAGAATGSIEENPWPDTSTDLAHAILCANEWRAARFGLDAALVDPAADDARTDMRAAIRILLDRVSTMAESQGDGAALARITTILDRGNGADRARAFFARCGGLRQLSTWLGAQTMMGTGLDGQTERRSNYA